MCTPANVPHAVAVIAQQMTPTFWYRRTVSEGTKGPIPYALARKRVTLCKDGEPAQTVWLLLQRTLGEAPR